jgi:hypothetical protein
MKNLTRKYTDVTPTYIKDIEDIIFITKKFKSAICALTENSEETILTLTKRLNTVKKLELKINIVEKTAILCSYTSFSDPKKQSFEERLYRAVMKKEGLVEPTEKDLSEFIKELEALL